MKGIILCLLAGPLAAQQLPFEVQDPGIAENLRFLYRRIEEKTRTPYMVSYSTAIIQNLAKTQSYFLEIDTDGAIIITSTTAATSTPWLFLSNPDRTRTFRLAVDTDGALLLQKLSFNFTSGDVPLLRRPGSRLAVLGVKHSGLNVTDAGVLP